MNYNRLIAGIFAGSGALLCIWQGLEKGEPYLVGIGTTILSGMMSFFVGENNGIKKAKAETE